MTNTYKVQTYDFGVIEVDGGEFEVVDGHLLIVGKAVFSKGSWSHLGTEEPTEVVAGPVSPRVWESLSDVPVSVRVRDTGGDEWRFFTDKDRWICRLDGGWDEGVDDPHNYAPFIEVLDA